MKRIRENYLKIRRKGIQNVCRVRTMAIVANEIGYLIGQKKIASTTVGGSFQVIDQVTGQEVYAGETTFFGLDQASKDFVNLADFTEVDKPGTYIVRDEAGEESCTFTIGEDVYHAVHQDMIKDLYFQRCGSAIEEAYAGIYKRPCCHKDTQKKAMLLTDHSVTMDVTGGWHDAGDYGKYISPAAVTIGHLLSAFCLYPEAFSDSLNIPESGNGMPDVLNECRYELDWMLKMQCEDGGVYHKTTTYVHAPFIMPEEDQEPFYVFPVSSMATADFAACMALSYRVYKEYDKEYAENLLEAGKKAFGWLKRNPEFLGFYNPKDCNTGEYVDDCDRDERLWAAAEMFVSTGDLSALEYFKELDQEPLGKVDFGWTDVSGFASLCVLTHQAEFPNEIVDQYKDIVYKEADRLAALSDNCGYGVCMEPEDYVWGSNMVVANRGILLLLAERIAKEDEKKKAGLYTELALNELHYLMGRNAMDVSYITGHGEHAYKHPHNRPTSLDGIDDPMPGWVSGGPFKDFMDAAALKALKKGTAPMKCYLDDDMSYSTNEITIYWNSAVIFITARFQTR